MIRKVALLAAVLLVPVSTARLHAQSSASATKPTQHQMAKQDSTKAATTPAADSQHRVKWTSAQIKEAQQGLAKAGFYKGKITGVFNADTRKALKEYQKKNNLPATGKLNQEVLNRLKSASS